MANRNRGRSTDDDGSVDEPIEDAYEDDAELEAEGRAERAKGKLREQYGKAKDDIRDAADRIAGDDE